jgi:hypothetical protein
MESKLTVLRNFLEQCPVLSGFEIKTDILSAKIGAVCLQNLGDSTNRVYYDILGNKFREMTFSALLSIKFTTEKEFMRAKNVLDFEKIQEWIFENENLLPPFGNFDQNLEQIRAENGILFDADKNGEAGTYQLQIAKNYTKIYYKE